MNRAVAVYPPVSRQSGGDLLANSLQFLRHLSDVGVLGTGINLQLVHHMTCQFVLWHHPTDGVENQVFGLACLTVGIAFQTQAGVAGVPGVVANVHFATRHADLFGVDDDDIIAAIDVRRVFRTVLAHQDHRDVAGQSAQNLIGGIDDKPVFFKFAGLGDVSSLSNHCLKTAV